MNTAALKELAEKIIPRKYLRVAGMYFLRAQNFRFKGDAVKCSCCKKKHSRFLPYGKVNRREFAMCPWCLALERHRLIYLYLEQKTNLYKEPIKLLHFAPEHQLQERFLQEKNIDYLSCDLDMPTAMDKQDITSLTYEDNRFDAIICNHVLEHIPNDAKAMEELYRVLKPNGWAILQTPMLSDLVSREDFSITDPKERERVFGQNDHVRIYGMDKKQRLENAGFQVLVDDFVRSNFSEKERSYLGLEEFEDVWLVKKLA